MFVQFVCGFVVWHRDRGHGFIYLIWLIRHYHIESGARVGAIDVNWSHRSCSWYFANSFHFTCPLQIANDWIPQDVRMNVDSPSNTSVVSHYEYFRRNISHSISFLSKTNDRIMQSMTSTSSTPNSTNPLKHVSERSQYFHSSRKWDEHNQWNVNVNGGAWQMALWDIPTFDSVCRAWRVDK